MALYVEFERCVGEKPATFCWHIGEGRLSDVVPDIKSVNEVQADGDELRMIRRDIEGIRRSNSQRVVIWRGDDAMFIVENL